VRLLFVAHDCCEAGAQHSLLRILRWLRANTAWDIGVLALGDGPLAPVYAGLAPLLVLPEPAAPDLERIAALTGGTPTVICGNTAVSARAYGLLAAFGVPMATRIAELDDSLARYLSPEARELLLRHSDAFVAVSGQVAEMLTARLGVAPGRIAVINGAVERTDTRLDAPRRAELLARFGLAPGARLLWGCGSVSWRKGSDLFLAVAEELLGLGMAGFHAFWAGYPIDELAVPLFLTKEQSPARHHATFLGRQPEPELLMAPGDIFLMTSREDPFPLVSLEAAERGVPSLCFPGCGGIEAFVRDGGGLVARAKSPADMARLALPLLSEPERAVRLGRQARALVLARHSMASAGPKFVEFFERLAAGAREPASPAAREPLADTLSVVIRGVGERTAAACRKLLRQAVPDENIVEVSATPFSAAIRKGFEAGIARGRRWTLVLDADVLVRADFPREIVDFAEAQGEDLFVAQGLVLDKMFGLLRPAGNHLYRTSLLAEALDCIPADGGGMLRPESATIDGMTSRGRLFIQTPLVAGLHDFEQHPLDIVRKCFVQAHKHGPYVDRVWPFWAAAAAADPDFAWAMLGVELGRAHRGAVYIDSEFLRERVADALAARGGGQLPPLDLDAVHEGYVQAALLAAADDPRTSVMQPFMFPPERWSHVYGGNS
jgi:hypothetical protein